MIFYFSGTGNTQWAARQLADATGERLLFIPDELNTTCHYELAEAERVGFCFPVHGWQPPHIVREFVSRLTVTAPSSGSKAPPMSPYVYALCTCGDSIGLSMAMFSQLLTARGLTLSSCQSLVMPESYVCLPFMYTDTPQREKAKISEAAAVLLRFTDIVKQRKTGYSDLKLGLTPWTFSHVIGAYFNRFMISDRKFTVDADRCTHCGRCQRACPVGDITIGGDGLPEWHHDNSCTNCLSCYHHCPHHAINYGSITRRRGQYYFGHRNSQT